MAGNPYRPSNGTEGMMFEEQNCYHCAAYNICNIYKRTWLYDLKDPKYPKQWVHDDQGRPMCTSYYDKDKVVRDRRELKRCKKTMEMFDAKST